MASEKGSEKKGMARTFKKAGRFFGMFAGAIRIGSHSKRDREYLGYESFSHLNCELLKVVQQIKQPAKHSSRCQ